MRISSPTQTEETLLTTRELGAGGCLLVTGTPFGTGRVLILNLSLGTHEVRAIAKVLYEYPWREGLNNSGVEFVYVNEEDQVRLETFITERLPEKHRAYPRAVSHA